MRCSFFFFLLLCSLFTSAFAQASTAQAPHAINPHRLAPPPKITAPRVIVIDVVNGRVLYEKNSRQPCAVASTQKLVTALCVLDTNLDKRFTIQSSDTHVVPIKVGIKAGETYSRRHLLTALLVRSGNDVARALARSVSGSQQAFARRMNQKAKSLGMTSSHFVNPHGLTAKGQYSTARDMAICARAALCSPTIRHITRKKSYALKRPNGKSIWLKSTNRLLTSYPYCTGLKTGTTRASGRCLIASGSYQGKTAITVVLGASSKTIWRDSKALLSWALNTNS